MKNKKKWIVCIACTLAVLIAAGIISTSFEKTSGHKLEMIAPAKLEGAEILVLGDSIMGYLRNSGRIEKQLKNAVGAEVYNAALGGTCAAVSDRNGGVTGELQFVRLTEAMKYKSFANIERNADMIQADVIYYMNDVLQKLKGMNYEDVDYILIHYGANDYFNGVPIEDYWFRKSEETFKGALRKGIETIHSVCPNATIILCTPIYCNFEKTKGFEGDSNSFSRGQGTLEKYAEAVREVAEEYGVYCIDGFSELEINKDNWKEYLSDGVHPDWRGMGLYAELIVEKLQEIEGNVQP